MDQKILEHLRAKLHEMMNERAVYVAGGGCPDFAEYKRVTGVIEGLAFAEREILDLAERLKQAEE